MFACQVIKLPKKCKKTDVARLLFKIFRHINIWSKLLSNKGLIIDRCCLPALSPSIKLDFRVKLVDFWLWPIVFVVSRISYVLLLFLIFFIVQWLNLPNQASNCLLKEVQVNLNKSLSCYLISLLTLNIPDISKYWWNCVVNSATISYHFCQLLE